VTRLFADSGRFSGAAGFTDKGKFLILQAKSAVLATGGFAQVYLKTNNAAGMTGDGQALAFDLGLPLKDIEFVQFYPTAVGDLGTRMLLYEGFVLRGGAELKNSAGENIVLKHGLNNPLALTRDRLARAVMEEIPPAATYRAASSWIYHRCRKIN
jgi:aspartate oxidase